MIARCRCAALLFSVAARVRERSFYRKFVAAMGETPAQYVESVRLDAARMLLAKGLSFKTIAAEVGLSATRFTKAFERRFGVSPQLFREMHHQGGRRSARGR